MALPNLNRIRRVNATLPPLQRDHTVPWQQVAGFRHLLISRLHLILPQKLGRASTERERESKEEEEQERERETESEQASRPRQADRPRQATAGQKQARAPRIARPPDQTRPFHTTFIIIPSFSFAFCIPASLPVSVDLWLLLSTADPQSSVLSHCFSHSRSIPKKRELLSYLPWGIDNILLLLCLLAKSSSASSIDIQPPPPQRNQTTNHRFSFLLLFPCRRETHVVLPSFNSLRHTSHHLAAPSPTP